MNCKNCQSPFQVTDSDRAFYQKMDVPEPTLCPKCRMQRRLAWRNERTLFGRTCSLCEKKDHCQFSAKYRVSGVLHSLLVE
ncbi:zinc-ribbon domain containing protein [Candidatus Peregrinibacteria bacterium]|nr:MAG: zinc-ribbon domain containing protein [Candidatus Peregrinibacteria bacterium]